MAHVLNAITVSGNILSNEFIHTSTVPGGKLPAFDPSSFDPDWSKDAEFEAAVSAAYEEIKDRFDALGTDLQYMDVASIRRQWLIPLLRALGFSPVHQRAHVRLSNVNESFPISHRGWDGEGAPALHLLSFQDDLDHKPAGYGAKSPHAIVQSYLNQDSTQSWGIVSNGHVLRLLRDYYHTSQPGYIQFDLLQLFLTRDFNEFRSLYRLAHATRFKSRGKVLGKVSAPTLFEEDEAEVAEAVDVVEEKELPTWLEVYYGHSRSEGSRAEESLRKNFQEALDVLGNGLLTAELRQELLERPEALEEYYRQLLRIIYRSIFLLFAEQRGLVPNPAPYAEVYRSEYSLTALRDLSEEQRLVRDEGHDLWERLLLTFELARTGDEELGVPAFNGNLFDHQNVAMLYGGEYEPEHRNDENLPISRMSNEQTLKFIECLAFTNVNGVLERINYRDIKVEEIGHIYESLLDYAPRIAEGDLHLGAQHVTRGMFFLDDRGMSRKSSGSYYTPRELVQEVISRSVLAVLEERLEAAGEDLKNQEEVIFSLKVLDPACGSGAFLIAANDALTQRLAELRWQAKAYDRIASAATNSALQALAEDAYAGPTRQETFSDKLQEARRDVLMHCIYGFDLNEMAVELAKVALWINAASEGKPLNFLDHRIKHGNSLVGAPPNFIQLGIHPDAYQGRGDENLEKLKEVRRSFTKKQLKQHRARMQGRLFDLSVEIPDLDSVEERGTADVQRKAELYRDFRERDAYKKWQLVADYWTSAFFYPVREGVGRIPTQGGLNYLLQSLPSQSFEQLTNDRLAEQATGKIAELNHQYRFFHYWLEFPKVFFDSDGSVREGGGFDVIAGNPPWERVKLQEKEFFSTRDAEIAGAANASKRKKLIEALRAENPDLYQAFQDALIEADATSNFLRVSGRYPLGGVGDVNTYQVFTENARDLTGTAGRTGLIVPSGIATDNTTKDLFRDFAENKSLVSLDDFENREGIFPGVHRSYKFCVLILTAPRSGPEEAHFSFFNTSVSHLKDLSRWFTLSFEDFARINPNTLTCPTYRTGVDAEIATKIYSEIGSFINDQKKGVQGNPWNASLLQGTFHSSNDSALFEAEEKANYEPLYEPKYFHQYNHRFASADRRFIGELKDSEYKIRPKNYVPSIHLENFRRITGRTWSLAYRRIARGTDERTMIATIIPTVAINENATCIASTENIAPLLANLNTIVLDYMLKLEDPFSVGNYILKQLPVLPPSQYTSETLHHIVPRVLELTYTAWDIKPFADDLWSEADEALWAIFRTQWQANAEASGGGHPFAPPARTKNAHDGVPLPPFTWNEARRADLRAELDALYAHLYGLTRDELRWILDPRDVDPTTPSLTFFGLRGKEEKRYGEYRTKRLVLDAYDELAQQDVKNRVEVSLD